MMIFLGAFALSMLAVLALTPALRSLATRLRFLDHPNRIKIHKSPTPLMGGIAVALASLASAAAALALVQYPYSARIVGFLAGGLIVVILGLADDANGMRPAVKLTGQATAAAVMILSGGVHGLPLHPVLGFCLALIWMVGLMNAFNFLDNMDGITSGLAAIATFGIFTLALGHGQTLTAIAAISVAGGTLGFLRYNFNPASIFLGDAGSLFLGYVVGGLSLRAVSYAGADSTALLIPVLMLGYPIFDATLVTVARLAEGRDVAVGGKDHSSHRLASLGLSARQTAACIYLISASLTGVAVYLSLFQRERLEILALATLAITGGLLLLGIRLFRVPTTESSSAARVRLVRPTAEEIALLASTGSQIAAEAETDDEALERHSHETIVVH
ncbi:undecaprenyl/decaprenyl-phosphate alpha-N-acetylglucosaminyl 1-phosphate transferase [bacterium]|nr:undecaprenyl/decaprenyl-phosphate alpha-N-acetylglucosaminyl 1-phosphate transferase [bacterium]